MLSEAIFSGWLAIFSPIPVTVAIDGKPVNLTEDGRVMTTPGKHVVELVSERFNYRAKETLDVRPGETTAAHADPADGKRARHRSGRRRNQGRWRAGQPAPRAKGCRCPSDLTRSAPRIPRSGSGARRSTCVTATRRTSHSSSSHDTTLCRARCRNRHDRGGPRDRRVAPPRARRWTARPQASRGGRGALDYAVPIDIIAMDADGVVVDCLQERS